MAGLFNNNKLRWLDYGTSNYIATALGLQNLTLRVGDITRLSNRNEFCQIQPSSMFSTLHSVIVNITYVWWVFNNFFSQFHWGTSSWRQSTLESNRSYPVCHRTTISRRWVDLPLTTDTYVSECEKRKIDLRFHIIVRYSLWHSTRCLVCNVD